MTVRSKVRGPRTTTPPSDKISSAHKRVYLAHPITMRSANSSFDWTRAVKGYVARTSPNVEVVDPEDYELSDHDRPAEIVRRNKIDILCSNLVVAVCVEPSFGVGSEIAFAHANGIWVVSIVQPEKGVSAWVREHSLKIFHKTDDLFLWLGDCILG